MHDSPPSPHAALTRHAIIAHLRTALAESDDIRAAWLGGSDAFARADDLSDVDVFILVRRGRVEEAADHFRRSVERISPITCTLRMPMPSWHGCHQAFYQLRDAPEHLMVDWLAVEQGQTHEWSHVERHGTPEVWFDKDGDIRPTHIDAAANRATVEKRIAELETRFRLFRHLAAKQAARGLPADGASFYHNHVVRPLVDLLRCVYCPERHDYGLRYLRDDLPRDVYERVCGLCYPAGVADLPRLSGEAAELFERTLAKHRGR
ncbi:MAG: hypothetical protein R3B68_15325 [Phycisphaerales bacterium]